MALTFDESEIGMMLPFRAELNLAEYFEVLLLVAHGPVESFNIGVLLGISWLDVFQVDAPVLGPLGDRAADVLWPVVAANDTGLAAPGNDLAQRPDHTL